MSRIDPIVTGTPRVARPEWQTRSGRSRSMPDLRPCPTQGLSKLDLFPHRCQAIESTDYLYSSIAQDCASHSARSPPTLFKVEKRKSKRDSVQTLSDVHYLTFGNPPMAKMPTNFITRMRSGDSTAAGRG